MKATLQKTSLPLSPLAAGAAIVLLSLLSPICVPAKAGPPLFRSTPRSAPSSRIQVGVGVGVYSGPVYRPDHRYRQQGNYYGSRSFYSPPSLYYPAPYCPPPAVYVTPPVYAAQPVYTAPPVYQGLPPASANYRMLAPSGSHLVAQVQEKLRSYGYYRGGVDGLAGTGTRSAIRAYQVDRGIQVTGRVDEELLSDLGL